MMKVIRIWDGCRVLATLSVDRETAGHVVVGGTGGAANSARVDIELDPFAGLIVDHEGKKAPMDFRSPDQDF